MLLSFAASLLALAAAPASAQPAEACGARALALPPALAAWAKPKGELEAGASQHAPLLALSRPASVRLRPAASMRWRNPPDRAPAPGTHGGLLTFRIASAGDYAVALSGAAWIDVIGETGAAVSVSHGHGPACSGIRKVVHFSLAPGDYTLQLSGSSAATIRLLVSPG